MVEFLQNIEYTDNDEDFIFDEPMLAVVKTGFFSGILSPWGAIDLKIQNMVPTVRTNGDPFRGSPKDPFTLVRLCLINNCRMNKNSFRLTHGLDNLSKAIEILENNRLMPSQILTNISLSDKVRKAYSLENTNLISDNFGGRNYIIIMPEPEYVGIYSEKDNFCRIGIRADCKAVLLE